MPRIGLHLTDRCQLDCDHCLRDPGSTPIDLPLEIIEAVLSDAQRAGIARLSMSGGEPTLHPRFPEILDLAVRFGMSWDIVTNGRRFERVARWLDEVPERHGACRMIAFSVDGATDLSHDGIRGTGQRREVLAAMSVAVALGIPFETTTTLHARNVSEIEAIARESADLGATSVRFAMMQPTGTHLDEGMRLAPSEWAAAYQRIRALAGTLRAAVVAAEGWPVADLASRPDARPCGPLRGDTLHVDHHGRLTLCCQLSGIPVDGPEDRAVAGDASAGLGGPIARLRQIRAEAQTARAIDAERAGPWRAFQCNSCLERFGRPHWTEGASAGAPARRERWRGDPERASSRRRILPVTH